MAFVNYRNLMSLLENNKMSDAERYLHNHTLDPQKPKENFELLIQSVRLQETKFMEKLFQKKLSSDTGNSAAQRFPVDLKDPDTGQTALHVAANSHNATVVFFLLEQHKPKAKQLPDAEGNFPLHLACLTEDILIVHLLLASKPSMDINAKNRAGKTALDCLQEKQPVSDERKKIIELLQQHKIAYEVSPETITPENLKKAAKENNIRPIYLAMILQDMGTIGKYNLLENLLEITIENDSLEVFRLLHECIQLSSELRNKNALKRLSSASKQGALKILKWLYQQYPQLDAKVVESFGAANDVAKEFLFPHVIEFLHKKNESPQKIIQWGMMQALKSKKAAALFCNFCRDEATRYYQARNFEVGCLYLDALKKFRPFDGLTLHFALLFQSQLWQEAYELCCCIIKSKETPIRQLRLAIEKLHELLNLNNDFCKRLPEIISNTCDIHLLRILAKHFIHKNQNTAEILIQKILQIDKDSDPLVLAAELDATDYFKNKVKSCKDIPSKLERRILINAVQNNCLGILKYLHEELGISLTKPLDIEEKPLSSLNFAVSSHAVASCRYILSTDVLDLKVIGTSLILDAAAADNISFMQELVDTTNIPIDANNEKHQAVVRSALTHSSIAALEYLESKQALLIENTIELAKKLAEGNNVVVLRFLMARGFAINKKYDKEEYELAHIAAKYDAIGIIRFLHEELQIPLDVKDKVGRSLINYANAGKAQKVRAYLVEKEAAFGVVNIFGGIPLHRSAHAGDRETLDWYQSKNQLDIYATNKKGETILDVAADSVREFLFNITAESYEKNKSLEQRMAWLSSTAAKSPQLKELCCEYLKDQSYKSYDESDFATGDIYLNTFEKISPAEAIEFRLEFLGRLQPKAQHDLCVKILADPQTSEDTKNKVREMLIQNLICGNFLLEDRCYAKLIALYEKHHSNYNKANLLQYTLFHHLRAIQALQLLQEMKKDDRELQQLLYGFLTNQSNPNRRELTANDFTKEAKLVYSVFYNSGPIPDIYDAELIAALPMLAPKSTTPAEQLLANSEILKGKRDAAKADLDERNRDSHKIGREEVADSTLSTPTPMQN